MVRDHIITGLMGVAVSLSLPNLGYAANCALRNPDRLIYKMFPEATSYRSVVASVDQDVKPAIEKRLGALLAFGDLGKHTIYVVLKEAVPIGFVHARSEVGQSGTVELVWAMDLDLVLTDFRVQRSREKHTEYIKQASFREKLLGRDLGELLIKSSDGKLQVNAAMLGIPAEAEPIARTAIFCGAKTTLITELAFGDLVFGARLIGNVHRFFPGTSKITRIRPLSPDDRLATTTRLAGFVPDQTDHASSAFLRAIGGNGQTLGVLAFSRWKGHATHPEVWCSVTPTSTLLRIVVVGKLEDRIRNDFVALEGKGLSGLKSYAGKDSPSPTRCVLEMLADLAGRTAEKSP